jgi:hypothetical protein
VRRARFIVLVPVVAVAVAACGSSELSDSALPELPSVSGTAAAPASGPGASPASSGNGVAALTADQILAMTKAALAAADGVRISGSGTAGGTETKIDMRYGQDRAGGSSTIDRERVDLVRAGDVAYVRASTAWWNRLDVSADVATALGGRYLKTAMTDPRFKDVVDYTTLPVVAEEYLKPGGTMSKGGTKTVAGTPAIGLVDSSGLNGTLWVATTGTPYPLSQVSEGGVLNFTEYGTPVTVPEPPAAQVVDADTLPGS